MERDDRMMQGEVGERNLGTDVTAEFTLPDYRPEIKRLLRVTAVLLPLDRYIGGNAAELSGTVEFQALYAANDGSLWCVTQREDYRLSCPLDLGADFNTANGLVCDVQTDAENITGRVSAPRKLTASCRVHARVRTLADRSVAGDAPTDEDFANTAERLAGTVLSARVYYGESAPLSLSDEIPLDGKDPSVRVISASGEVFPSDVQAGSGVVTCRGEVCLSLLCVSEPAETPSLDGAEDCVPANAPAPYAMLRRLPFAAEIPVDGAEVNCSACAWGVCSEINVTVEEGRILCDVTCALFARAERNEEIPYTRDLYSTARETEPVFRRLPTARSLACRNGNFSLTTALPAAEAGIRPDATVVSVLDAETRADAAERARGSYLLSGTARFRVLLRAPDGEYSVSEFDVPFRYETPAADGDADMEPTACDSVIRAVMSRARLDGERVAVEAELSVALALRSVGEVSALSEVRLGAPVPAQGAACVICYPSPDDTLWSVARRYHAPLSALLAKNRLATSAAAADAAESLSGVPFLVI